MLLKNDKDINYQDIILSMLPVINYVISIVVPHITCYIFPIFFNTNNKTIGIANKPIINKLV